MIFRNFSAFSIEEDFAYLVSEEVPASHSKTDYNNPKSATKSIFDDNEIKPESDESETLSINSSENLSKQKYFSIQLSVKLIDDIKRSASIPKLIAKQGLNKEVSFGKNSNINDSEVNSKISKEITAEALNMPNTAKLKIIKNEWKNNYFKNLMFNQNVSNEFFYRYLAKIYNELRYARSLKLPNEKNILSKSIKLKTKKLRKCLLFELEYTLLYTTTTKQKTTDFKIEYNDDGNIKKAYINLRPFCIENLHFLSQYYNLFIFTTHPEPYVRKIIEFLDPDKNLFSGYLTQSHCFKTSKDTYVKDLRIIKNKEVTDMVLIDHMCHSFAAQLDNGIPIIPWEGDPYDIEMKYLSNYLVKLNNFQDLRVGNRMFLKLEDLASKNMKDVGYLNFFM